MKEKERSRKNTTPERKENSARSERAWREKRQYCESQVHSILWKQENFYCQLVSLIIQLNVAVGDVPLEALAQHPALLYSLMVLLTGLGALAKFASKPRSLASNELMQGVKNLMLDAKRANEPDLDLNIVLEFPDEGNILVDQIKEKISKDIEITSEEVEMIKCQNIRTNGLVDEWNKLFQPFQHPSYHHHILHDLPQKLIQLFKDKKSPGRRLLKHLLPHAKLKPSSRSISKEMIDGRQQSRRPLQPWGKSRKDSKSILIGPKENLKIPRQPQLLPCSTTEEKRRAEAWLKVSLTEVARNPMLLVSHSFVYDAEQVVTARQKKEYESVWPGLESILSELGVNFGEAEVYDPETPQGRQEEGQVEEEESEEDEEDDREEEEEEDDKPDRLVVLVNQEEDDEEPENADGDTLSIGAGSTLSLYEEDRGKDQRQAAGPKNKEKAKPEPEPEQRIQVAVKESTELLSASLAAVITTTSKMLSPELKEIKGQLSRLEQGLQTANAAVEELKELKEEVRNMATMLKEMKKQVGVTYETVSINSLLEWKKQEKQEKQEKKEKQEAAKRPRPDKTPESNKKQRQEAGKAASKK